MIGFSVISDGELMVSKEASIFTIDIKVIRDELDFK